MIDPAIQMEVLNKQFKENPIPRFDEKLKAIGQYPLKPTNIEILQINMGYMCNIECEHCHVNAGPGRKEIMTKDTLQSCLDIVKKNTAINTIDLTGGAPEMNPHFQWFIEKISNLKCNVLVRSNLTILVSNKKFRKIPELLAKHKVEIIASLPCYTEENTDRQRGKGVFNRSIEALKILNNLGYGKENSGLKLHIVYNPLEDHLPPEQSGLEQDYKKELKEKFGIEFNTLYNITNMPVGRYLDKLMNSNKYGIYMNKLIHAFNPVAAKGVMCRNTISVGWDGILYDCDFNQMLALKVQHKSVQHIRDFNFNALMDREIIINRHCFGCTAGAGSSCQGAIS